MVISFPKCEHCCVLDRSSWRPVEYLIKPQTLWLLGFISSNGTKFKASTLRVTKLSKFPHVSLCPASCLHVQLHFHQIFVSMAGDFNIHGFDIFWLAVVFSTYVSNLRNLRRFLLPLHCTQREMSLAKCLFHHFAYITFSHASTCYKYNAAHFCVWAKCSDSAYMERKVILACVSQNIRCAGCLRQWPEEWTNKNCSRYMKKWLSQVMCEAFAELIFPSVVGFICYRSGYLRFQMCLRQITHSVYVCVL